MQLQLKVTGLLDAEGFVQDSYPEWIVVEIQGSAIRCAEFGGAYTRSKDGLIDWAGNEIELGSRSYARLMEALGGQKHGAD